MAERSPETKRVKMADALTDLGGFEMVEILRNDTDHMRCALHARNGSGDSAVIVLNKNPFSKDTLPGVLTEESRAILHSHNDIYGSYDIELPRGFSSKSQYFFAHYARVHSRYEFVGHNTLRVT